MSIATIATPPIATPTRSGYQARRWTVAEFERMIAAGVIREGGPEFLWDGEVLLKMTEHEPHINAVDNLLECLLERLPRPDWVVRHDHPIRLGDHSMPEPDLVVARGPRSAYRACHPTPTEIALVVEVANTSYPDDASLMRPIYAASGIVQYWIVHIRARRVEVFENPRVEAGVGAYDPPRLFGLDAAVPLVLHAGPGGPGRDYPTIPVVDILRDSLEEDR